MRLKLDIVGLLSKGEFTINGIAEALDENYSFVHKIVNELVDDGVINKRKIGKAFLCSLNFDNEETFVLLKLNEVKRRNKFYIKNNKLKLILDDFVGSVKDKFKKVDVIVLFGSYVKGSMNKDSDIDVLIVGNGEIGKVSKEIYAKYGKEINPVVMGLKSFIKEKDKVIIKEIIENHYVLYGVEKFIDLVFK